MAGKGGAGKAPGKVARNKRRASRAKPRAKLPLGRPARLAHLVAGNHRQLRRERAQLASVIEGPPRKLDPTPAEPALAQLGLPVDILCLPNPEWLPHVLTVMGPTAELAAFRLAAAGPGSIPWVAD